MSCVRILIGLALTTILLMLGCSGSGEQAAQAEVVPADAAATEELVDPSGEEAPAPAAASRRLNVLIYYTSRGGRGLVGEPHEIFMTPTPGDRAKQIIADLIAGPIGERGLRSLPAGTRLRQVYVLEGGTAYVDFSADLKQQLSGGSSKELLAVYSIVNSLALNIPEIRRVGILIEGEPIETLNGHMDLSRPLSPNTSWVVARNVPSVDDAARGAGWHVG